MAQEPSSEFLLAAPGIQHRVPRRTALAHTVPQITDDRTAVRFPCEWPDAGVPDIPSHSSGDEESF
jgi:hypothetical protein